MRASQLARAPTAAGDATTTMRGTNALRKGKGVYCCCSRYFAAAAHKRKFATREAVLGGCVLEDKCWPPVLTLWYPGALQR